MSEAFHRAAELFERARLLNVEQREQLLDAALNEYGRECIDEVRLLLQEHELDNGAWDGHVILEAISELSVSRSERTSSAPDRIGPYVVTDVLGRGGMGVVYRARQQNPSRDVAVKMIRPGLIDDGLRRRFKLEAAVLGRLQHPGIAQIHEAGMHDGADCEQPYFVMEFVDGLPLKRYVRETNLDQRERLRIFILICEAVHHAHERGVIHRDLKPGNILVTASGQPKVLDFGVARATDPDMQAATIRTATGQLIGTLSYMSPEQVTGRTRSVDATSDVYALGVLLYELLTDRLPHDLEDQSLVAAAKVICDEDPTPLTTVHRSYRGDLNTIVLKALSKEPYRRYRSAANFARDIQRYLNDEPIAARPASTTYQVRKFAKRNKGLVAGLCATVAVLVAGIVTTTTQAIRATKEKQAAELEAEFSREISQFYKGILTSVDSRWCGVDAKVSDALARAETQLDRTDATARVESRLREALAAGYEHLGMFEKANGQAVIALKKAEVHYGRQAIETMDALMRSANASRFLGDFQASEDAYREVLAFLRTKAPTETKRIATCLDGLATTLSEATRYEEGLLVAREALAHVQESSSGRTVNGYDVGVDVGVRSTLAGILHGLRQFDEAEQLAKEAAQIATDEWGKSSPHLQMPLNILVIVCNATGRYDEAIEIQKRLLAISKAAMAENHPAIGVGQVNLGMSLQRVGKMEAAESEYRKAAVVLEATLERDHPYVLTALAALGNLLHETDRLDEAEPVLREVLAARQRVLGHEHKETIISLWNLQTWYRKRGEFDEAASLVKPELDRHIANHGRKHSRTISVLSGYAENLLDAGEVEESLPLLRESYEHWLGRLGASHSQTTKYRNRMNEALKKLGRDDEVEPGLPASTEAGEAVAPTS